ncbi:CRISPR-associated helicase Cas3' [Clostridium aciditolerans]|uniref:CRISPR-associated helicase Cas3 n=1 Tax=Clostridium aciditolerans TaxID=339861 RepID=A0A934HW24_9CLOT|nr:CRISPR-associated helicase Cas3' [Clostridium aciditolerans]MBI6875676.1 CRISPR-associated helicase Cas3' [Clostridium aciditolerans]
MEDINSIIYAKSKPEETLKQHTNSLIGSYNQLREVYESKINKIIGKDKESFWKLLDVAIKYHDFGKVFTPFQNVIRNKLEKEELETSFQNDIPHNYLSPTFIPYKKLDIYDNEELMNILIQTIGYHHERDKQVDKYLIEYIEKVIEEDLEDKIEILKEHMGFEVRKSCDYRYLDYLKSGQRIKEGDKNYNFYIMSKGLLHRIDHSASAHVDIEDKAEVNLAEKTKEYIKTEFNSEPRNAQKFAYDNRDKNVILVASTGRGKTEAALFWINDDKGFITLPLRVSINALYSRVSSEIGFEEYTGLIHSSSLDYLEEQGIENASQVYEQSKLLSKKLSFSTIDQLFKFPFKHKGYEKIYATLAYSKVVIDEIQAYTPEIAAAILKGIVMLYNIGGKFMIMTATLPRIYKDYLQENGINDFEYCEDLSEDKRHRVSIIDENIDEAIDEIIEKGSKSKVLVIVNTVKKALKFYEELKNREVKNCNLLHSMFIQQDRALLEERIKDFAGSNKENKEPGIWVTTQIVEASLDVDFDYLYTEISTLDSSFQRFGRCNRKGKKEVKDPNVYIFTKDATGVGSIYDKEIVEKGISFLEKFVNESSDGFMTEKDKVKMVDKLYSKEELKGTRFYEEFKKAINCLNNTIDYEVEQKKAQKLLRDIDSITVIPKEIYDKNIYLFECYEDAEVEDKGELLRKINKLTLNIPKSKIRTKKLMPTSIKYIEVLNVKYSGLDDEGKGIMLDEELDNIW